MVDMENILNGENTRFGDYTIHGVNHILDHVLWSICATITRGDALESNTYQNIVDWSARSDYRYRTKRGTLQQIEDSIESIKNGNRSEEVETLLFKEKHHIYNNIREQHCYNVGVPMMPFFKHIKYIDSTSNVGSNEAFFDEKPLASLVSGIELTEKKKVFGRFNPFSKKGGLCFFYKDTGNYRAYRPRNERPPLINVYPGVFTLCSGAKHLHHSVFDAFSPISETSSSNMSLNYYVTPGARCVVDENDLVNLYLRLLTGHYVQKDPSLVERFNEIVKNPRNNTFDNMIGIPAIQEFYEFAILSAVMDKNVFDYTDVFEIKSKYRSPEIIDDYDVNLRTMERVELLRRTLNKFVRHYEKMFCNYTVLGSLIIDFLIGDRRKAVEDIKELKNMINNFREKEDDISILKLAAFSLEKEIEIYSRSSSVSFAKIFVTSLIDIHENDKKFTTRTSNKKETVAADDDTYSYNETLNNPVSLQNIVGGNNSVPFRGGYKEKFPCEVFLEYLIDTYCRTIESENAANPVTSKKFRDELAFKFERGLHGLKNSDDLAILASIINNLSTKLYDHKLYSRNVNIETVPASLEGDKYKISCKVSNKILKSKGIENMFNSSQEACSAGLDMDLQFMLLMEIFLISINLADNEYIRGVLYNLNSRRETISDDSEWEERSIFNKEEIFFQDILACLILNFSWPWKLHTMNTVNMYDDINFLQEFEVSRFSLVSMRDFMFKTIRHIESGELSIGDMLDIRKLFKFAKRVCPELFTLFDKGHKCGVFYNRFFKLFFVNNTTPWDGTGERKSPNIDNRWETIEKIFFTAIYNPDCPDAINHNIFKYRNCEVVKVSDMYASTSLGGPYEKQQEKRTYGVPEIWQHEKDELKTVIDLVEMDETAIEDADLILENVFKNHNYEDAKYITDIIMEDYRNEKRGEKGDPRKLDNRINLIKNRIHTIKRKG